MGNGSNTPSIVVHTASGGASGEEMASLPSTSSALPRLDLSNMTEAEQITFAKGISMAECRMQKDDDSTV